MVSSRKLLIGNFDMKIMCKNVTSTSQIVTNYLMKLPTYSLVDVTDCYKRHGIIILKGLRPNREAYLNYKKIRHRLMTDDYVARVSQNHPDSRVQILQPPHTSRPQPPASELQLQPGDKWMPSTSHHYPLYGTLIWECTLLTKYTQTQNKQSNTLVGGITGRGQLIKQVGWLTAPLRCCQKKGPSCCDMSMPSTALGLLPSCWPRQGCNTAPQSLSGELRQCYIWGISLKDITKICNIILFPY